MKAFLRFLGTLALAAVALVAMGALVVFTGSYNVSATSGHTKLVENTLSALMVRSVRAHAREVLSPVSMDFRDPAVLAKAAGQYEAMCRTCHGAPGKKADPWMLYPPAPDLAEALRERAWTDSEVFWITKHGIKDTAMGAFGGSHPGAHSDEDLWGLTALIRQFSTLSPEQYQALVERAGASRGAEGASGAHQPTGRASHDAEQKHDAQKSGQPHKH